MPKGKVLFLHGYGESAMMAAMSTAALKKALDAANFELLAVPNAWQIRHMKDAIEGKPVAAMHKPELPEKCANVAGRCVELNGMTRTEKAYEELMAMQPCSEMGGPVDDDGNPLMDWRKEHPMTDMERHIHMLVTIGNGGKPPKYTTWKIPKDAPEGWGRGNGAKWLRDNPLPP